ncbi:MAG: 16S rRNA (guanine(527)-N(7))-methyltransferase RsmG [Pseudomonadota bacterium]
MNIDRVSELVGSGVSRETLDRLAAYQAALLRWSKSINLVSKSSLRDAGVRHFEDSLQVMAMAPEGDRWVDLGSGGGFPGLVVALVSAETRPSRHVTLIESDSRKAEFLRHVSRETSVDVTVLNMRIEEAPAQHAHVVSARALADLDLLLEYCSRHLSTHGQAVLLKGAKASEEVIDSRKRWSYDVEMRPSRTDPTGVLLKIRGLQRV